MSLNPSYEKKYWAENTSVAGVDEAGIGPLAGPVVAAAVMFEQKHFKVRQQWWEEINDSKKLSHKKREELVKLVYSKTPNVGVGSASVEEIDDLNILQARLLAMKRAIENLNNTPEIVLVDGNRQINTLNVLQRTIVKGDEKVLSIAAASIVAKVTRDNILKNLHEQFPQYGFDQHKGYPTQFHFEMLQKFGPCEVHRKSFAPVRSVMIENKT
jgi:ribonuclease HII